MLDQEAMDALNISREDQERVFKLLAAVLWLGNVSFEVTDHENHITVMIDEGTSLCLHLYNDYKLSLISKLPQVYSSAYNFLEFYIYEVEL